MINEDIVALTNCCVMLRSTWTSCKARYYKIAYTRSDPITISLRLSSISPNPSTILRGGQSGNNEFNDMSDDDSEINDDDSEIDDDDSEFDNDDSEFDDDDSEFDDDDSNFYDQRSSQQREGARHRRSSPVSVHPGHSRSLLPDAPEFRRSVKQDAAGYVVRPSVYDDSTRPAYQIPVLENASVWSAMKALVYQPTEGWSSLLKPTLEGTLNDAFDLYDDTIPLVHLPLLLPRTRSSGPCSTRSTRHRRWPISCGSRCRRT